MPGAELILADGADLPLATAAVEALGARPGRRRTQERALPGALLRSRLQDLTVSGDHGAAVLELELEEPAVAVAGDAPRALAPRLRVRPVDGHRDAFDRALLSLAQDGAWAPAVRTLLDEAAAATGRRDAGLACGMRADEAAGRLLGTLHDAAVANVEGTLADRDPECLHDLRVAVRRARSVLRELKGVLDPEARRHVRDELRWVQRATGELRDLDVQLDDWAELTGALDDDTRRDLEPLREALARRRAAVVAAVSDDLRGPRFAAALDAWRELGAAPLPSDPGPQRPRAQTPVEAVAADRIRRVYRRMVRDGRAIGEDSPPEALHELRKRGKELRYLLELFGGLYPPKVVKPMVKSLKRLQDVLGRHQDRAVQADVLQRAAADVSPATRAALHRLAEALRDDQHAARAEFAARFGAFAGKDQRKLVRRTFAKLEG